MKKKDTKSVDEYKRTFSLFESIVSRKLNSRQTELRHITLFMHNYLEGHIDIRIIMKKLNDMNITENELQDKVSYSLRQLLDEIDFARKIKLALQIGAISKPLSSALHKLNEYRIYFAHPNAYRNQLYKFDSEPELLKAYKVIYETMNLSVDTFAEMESTTKKIDSKK